MANMDSTARHTATNTAFLDRTTLFQPHIGPNILPNNPLFTRLLRHAQRNNTAIIDLNLHLIKTYADLLSDVLSLRNALRQRLRSRDVARLDRGGGEEVYVGVLAAGGYEWTVAMLAVLALGAAVVPMSVNQPVAEVEYLVRKASVVGIVCGREGRGLAAEVVKGAVDGPVLADVLPNLPAQPTWRAEEIVVSSDRCQDDNGPGLVIFTSGTTGRPKGCVLRRLYTHESAATVMDSFDITAADTVLHVLPVHHATGIGTSFFPFMNAGACILFRSGSFDPAWVWETLCEGRVTVFSGVPTMYMRLMWYYEQHIATLHDTQRARYDAAIRNLRALLCGSSALQQRVQDFWTRIRNGRPILVRYGSSEVPSVIRVPARLDPARIPAGCVGLPSPGLDWCISDEGELLLRSPFMFSKYLHDPEATFTAHTEDGYFRTGDLARIDRDGFIFIDGRVSTDVIKSGGYKIGAPDIERAILELPYVKEAMVVGVEDDEWGQRVGAAVVLVAGEGRTLALERLRKGLRKSLPGYKVPTLLRLVDGELPKGETGKVQKKILGPKYFVPHQWPDDPEVQLWKPAKL